MHILVWVHICRYIYIYTHTISLHTYMYVIVYASILYLFI